MRVREFVVVDLFVRRQLVFCNNFWKIHWNHGNGVRSDEKIDFFSLYNILHYLNWLCFFYNSTSSGDENQPSNMKDTNQTAVMDKTVQQMTHGFVTLFEKELDQVQYSLKEAL